jgi:hypothetical protein
VLQGLRDAGNYKVGFRAGRTQSHAIDLIEEKYWSKVYELSR